MDRISIRVYEHNGCQGCKYGRKGYGEMPCSHCRGTVRPDSPFYSMCADLYEPEKTATNGDRIRAMSDKELVRHYYCGAPYCKSDEPRECTKSGYIDGLGPCERCYLDWLKQSAEEG